jgi:hypothetical protein
VDHSRLTAAVRDRAYARVVELLVAQALTPIATGQSSIQAVRHPLGFTCIPICRLERVGACIHLWQAHPQRSRVTTSPYHCHSWHLLSFILDGCVGNQLVEVTPGTTYRAFEVRGNGSVDTLVRTERLYDARAAAPEYWSAGEYYELPAGAFHASAIRPDSPAATVVLGFYNPNKADITLGGLDTPDHQVTRRRYHTTQTARIAAHTITRLNALAEQAPQLVTVRG